ncbi:MAG: hypothetical protein ACI4UF_02440 [Thermoguttaceae bacterium]
MTQVPGPFRGVGIALITASILAMAFMGFSGVDKGIQRLVQPQQQETTQAQDTPPAQNVERAQL